MPRTRSPLRVRSSKSKSDLNQRLLKHGIVYRFGDFRYIIGYSKKTGKPLTKRGHNPSKEDLAKLGVKAMW